MPDPFAHPASILSRPRTSSRHSRHTTSTTSQGKRHKRQSHDSTSTKIKPDDSAQLMPVFFNLNPGLPKHDATRVAQVLDLGLARNTKSHYESSVRAYLEFCASRQIDQCSRFPASESTILAFAASMASQKSASSISGMLSGLKMWHILHNVPWPSIDCMNTFLKGLAAVAPPSWTHNPGPPVTTAMLVTLHQNLALDMPRDVAIFAAACTILWGQCCSSKVLGTSRTVHLPRVFPSHCSLLNLFSAAGSCELMLPCTKTQQHTGDRVTILQQYSPADPIWALQNHLYINQAVPAAFHLFGYMRRVYGKWTTRCLTKEEFLDQCNEIWISHGYPRITGHSFQIGGTTKLLLRGVNPEIVKQMGRWSSDAHMRYWRKTNEIVASQAECLPASSTLVVPPASARNHNRGRARHARTAWPRGAPY
ncbi:Reverse transcriptase domain protein [Ceratobasidium sp. AG-Ba]|nr:Reverse transcriptase domain protein [Ceratobasidium sp. AG-Ba]